MFDFLYLLSLSFFCFCCCCFPFNCILFIYFKRWIQWLVGASFSRMNLSASLVVNFFSLRRIIYVFLFFIFVCFIFIFLLLAAFISIFMTFCAFSAFFFYDCCLLAAGEGERAANLRRARRAEPRPLPVKSRWPIGSWLAASLNDRGKNPASYRSLQESGAN